ESRGAEPVGEFRDHSPVGKCVCGGRPARQIREYARDDHERVFRRPVETMAAALDRNHAVADQGDEPLLSTELVILAAATRVAAREPQGIEPVEHDDRSFWPSDLAQEAGITVQPSKVVSEVGAGPVHFGETMG